MLDAWDTRVDGIDYARNSSESPNVGIGVRSGRSWSMFGDTVVAPTATASGGPDSAKMWQLQTEALVVAAAANSNTANTSFLPINTILHPVSYRVRVAIPTATTFQLGDATTPARFGTGIAVALGTNGVAATHLSPANTTVAQSTWQTANASLRLTPSATPATGVGVVKLWMVAEITGIPSS